MATTFTKVIDPDNGGGTDYTSLDAWEDALGGTTGGDLVGDDEIAIANCRSSGGTADVVETSIGGWPSTGAGNYIKVTSSDFPVDGIWDDTAYRIHINSDSNREAVTVTEDYVYLEKLQIHMQDTGGVSVHYGLSYNNIGAASVLDVDSCIIKATMSGSGKGYAIYVYETDNVKISNTLFYDWNNGAGDADFTAIRQFNSSGRTNTYLFNCTIENCQYGIREDRQVAVDCYNVIIANSLTAATIGTVNQTTGQTAGTGGNWDNDFTDLAGEDYSLKAGSDAVGNGTDTPTGYVYSDDIIGTARSSAWDIGAFEFAAVIGVELLAGIVDAQSAVSGDMKSEESLQGSLGGQSGAVANLQWLKELAGLTEGHSTVVGKLQWLQELIGSVGAQSSSAGNIISTEILAGLIEAQSSVAGDIIIAGFLSLGGSIAAQAALTAKLREISSLSGSLAAQSSVTGNLQWLLELAGSIGAQSVIVGKLQWLQELAGLIEAQSSSTGNILSTESLAGLIETQSTVTGVLKTIELLTGEIAAQSSLIGYIQLGGITYKVPIITGTPLVTGDVLRWDGSNWVNFAGFYLITVDDLPDPAVNGEIIRLSTNNQLYLGVE